MTVEEFPRCYRCLEPSTPKALTLVAAPCDCEHGYCERCLRSGALLGWLGFLASRCLKWLRAAA